MVTTTTNVKCLHYLTISVITPVPTVLCPSLRVNLWLISRGIGFFRVSVNRALSPGITISLSVCVRVHVHLQAGARIAWTAVYPSQ